MLLISNTDESIEVRWKGFTFLEDPENDGT